MDDYWLTPVTSLQPFTLGEDRLMLESGAVDNFRRKLSAVHPRLLLFFKANLLLSDDAASCGVDDLPFELSDGLPVTFDEALPLSHCAEAFFDRMPSAGEQTLMLEKALAGTEWTVTERTWLKRWNDWLRQGWPVILLR